MVVKLTSQYRCFRPCVNLIRSRFTEFNFGLYRSIVTPVLQETECSMQIYEVERLQYVNTLIIIQMHFCCLIVRISLTLICIRCRCKFIAAWLINIAGYRLPTPISYCRPS
jgi:hypothetical protein